MNIKNKDNNYQISEITSYSIFLINDYISWTKRQFYLSSFPAITVQSWRFRLTENSA